MNQPVRLGLVFSRSGQQLTVHISRHLLESADICSDQSLNLEELPKHPAVLEKPAAENAVHTP